MCGSVHTVDTLLVESYLSTRAAACSGADLEGGQRRQVDLLGHAVMHHGCKLAALLVSDLTGECIPAPQDPRSVQLLPERKLCHWQTQSCANENP